MQNKETVSGRPKRERFTMIRSFVMADFLTLANAACGSGAVLASMQYLISYENRWLWLALILLPFALMFDFLDGRVARWRQKTSALGADLDSLADIISFGLAPAAIGFAVGMRGVVDVLVLLYFVCCGISRLARFNTTAVSMSDETGKVSHFEGTPIPTSVGIVLIIALLASLERVGDQLWLGAWEFAGMVVHPFVFIYAVSGSLMISTLRIPKI